MIQTKVTGQGVCFDVIDWDCHWSIHADIPPDVTENRPSSLNELFYFLFHLQTTSHLALTPTMSVICARSNVGQRRHLQAGQLSQLGHGPLYALVVLASTGDLESICALLVQVEVPAILCSPVRIAQWVHG